MTLVPNVDQVKSSIAWAAATFGGAIGGWFAAKGYFTVDQVTSVLNNQSLIAAAATVIVWIWRVMAHTNAAKINAAAKVTEVNESALTPEGLKLACAAPNTEVKPA